MKQAGGPYYDIPKGRKDGIRSRIEDTANLPSPFFNASQLISTFAQRGFTVQQMVALSGQIHTLNFTTIPLVYSILFYFIF